MANYNPQNGDEAHFDFSLSSNCVFDLLACLVLEFHTYLGYFVLIGSRGPCSIRCPI